MTTEVSSLKTFDSQTTTKPSLSEGIIPLSTHPKPIKTKHPSKTKQLRLDSMTGVYPKHTHGLGIWGNPRVVMSVRVDKKLKLAFKDASKALFGSTCNPIESWMAGIVGIHQNQKMSGVNPSITVDIGEIKIERNLRERRKLGLGRVNGEREKSTLDLNETLRCGFARCKEEAVSLGVYKGVQYRLCSEHLVEALNNRKCWTVSENPVG